MKTRYKGETVIIRQFGEEGFLHAKIESVFRECGEYWYRLSFTDGSMLEIPCGSVSGIGRSKKARVVKIDSTRKLKLIT